MCLCVCVCVCVRVCVCVCAGLLKIVDLMAQLRSALRLLWHIFTPIKEFYGTNTHAHTNTFKTPNKRYFGYAIYFKTKNINSLTLGNKSSGVLSEPSARSLLFQQRTHLVYPLFCLSAIRCSLLGMVGKR